MPSSAEVVAFRCHICDREFSAEGGGLCISCMRLTCDRCWGDGPRFLSSQQPQRTCKQCVVKNRSEADVARHD